MTAPCNRPLGTAKLLDYWLGELDADRTDQVDEHLLGCDACGENLASLVEVGGAIRAATRSGAAAAVVSDAFLWRLAADWVRVREYRVACDGSVQCTVSPNDDLVVARLEAPLAGVEHLDIEIHGMAGDPVLRDVPFDAASGEIVVVNNVEALRALPATTVRMRAVAVDGDTRRQLGEYTFHHTPGP